MRLQPGDLVTGADASEGAPSWLGKVKSITKIHWVKRRGHRQPEPMAKWAFRPLTDFEAVGLAEALTGEKWEVVDLWYDGPVASHVLEVGDITAASTILSPFNEVGGWHLLAGGRLISAGDEEGEAGKVAASRAFLHWMCEGSRGVDKACVS